MSHHNNFSIKKQKIPPKHINEHMQFSYRVVFVIYNELKRDHERNKLYSLRKCLVCEMAIALKKINIYY